MKQFIQRYDAMIQGVLNGFDRLRFRGTFRLLANVRGMHAFLAHMHVRLKEFGSYVESISDRIRDSVTTAANATGRPVEYLYSSGESKEEKARQILAQEGTAKSGLICVLSCVESCRTYSVHKNAAEGLLELVYRPSRCLHYYHYYQDSMFGFMHVRTQTWFPFTTHICLNGREWLAGRLDAARIGYRRRDNCFVEVENVAQAQRFLDQQRKAAWAKHLNRLVQRANPILPRLFADFPLHYYWSLEESEWASDVMFHSAADLARLYPRLLLHGMTHFGSQDVMRFLGRKTPAVGGPHGNFAGEVVSDLRSRPEGVRIKHRINHNSIKMYDKQGSVLRVETTINDPRDMKVYRPKGDPEKGEMAWQPMRKGIADLYRRAEVSQAANERYLDGLAQADDATPLGELLKELCRPTTWNKQRVRALNPFAADDGRLLTIISRGEFHLNGFRNRDIRLLWFGSEAASDDERRRQAAAVTRKLRMLRAHHLIRKVPKSHRYQLTERGTVLVAAITAVKNATTKQLTPAA